jgi:hypothetical protein
MLTQVQVEDDAEGHSLAKALGKPRPPIKNALTVMTSRQRRAFKRKDANIVTSS